MGKRFVLCCLKLGEGFKISYGWNKLIDRGRESRVYFEGE